MALLSPNVKPSMKNLWITFCDYLFSNQGINELRNIA